MSVHNTNHRPVWLVRAGQHGGDEAIALAKGIAVIGFRDVPNLAQAQSRDHVISLIQQASPQDPLNRIRNWASQLYAFAHRMEVGDIVVLPLKTSSGKIALGRVTGPYKQLTISGEKRHTRKVDWVQPDVLRTDIEQDLLYSLGAFMTVCRIRRNDAEKRFAALLQGNPDPGY